VHLTSRILFLRICGEVTDRAAISSTEDPPADRRVRLNQATVTAIADKDDYEVSDKSDDSLTPVLARPTATT
jgi:hypothetical protein